jgi:hypothetical protein
LRLVQYSSVMLSFNIVIRFIHLVWSSGAVIWYCHLMRCHLTQKKLTYVKTAVYEYCLCGHCRRVCDTKPTGSITSYANWPTAEESIFGKQFFLRLGCLITQPAPPPTAALANPLLSFFIRGVWSQIRRQKLVRISFRW